MHIPHRIYLIFLICALALAIQHPISAQETGDFRVQLSAANEDDLRLLESLAAEIQAWLDLYAIDLQIQAATQNTDTAPLPTLTLHLDPANSDQIRLSFDAPDPLHARSPLLNSHLFATTDHDISLPLDDKTASYSAGLILYLLGRCDAFRIRASAAPAPFQTITQIYEANCAILNDDLEAAESLYGQIMAALPLHQAGPIATNLGWVRLQTTGLAVADAPLQQVQLAQLLRFSPGWRIAQVLRARAGLYALTSRWDEAIVLMSMAIQLAPTNAEYLLVRGQMLLGLYEWDRVLVDYNRALMLDAELTDVYFYRGVLYYSILQTGLATRDEALADFITYLELEPAGIHADAARQYLESIETELQALGD